MPCSPFPLEECKGSTAVFDKIMCTGGQWQMSMSEIIRGEISRIKKRVKLLEMQPVFMFVSHIFERKKKCIKK